MIPAARIRYAPIAAPPPDQRRQRLASFAGSSKATRYTLPAALDSGSPIGFRTRLSLTPIEAQVLLDIAQAPRPSAFAPAAKVTEQRLFEESSLSLLLARQSTNFRGWHDVIVHGVDAARVAHLLQLIKGRETAVLQGASHCHLVWSRPYRTPFTQLLTFIGHRPIKSLVTVPWRAVRKQFWHDADIPTIGHLKDLHLGILADAFDRAVVVASRGQSRATVHLAPLEDDDSMTGRSARTELESMAGLTAADKRAGWRLGLVAQVGSALPQERFDVDDNTAVRLGAAMVALRSERIQPGVNVDDKAPEPYRDRQDMDVSDDLLDGCGRALYDAFAQFSGRPREVAKQLVLLDRMDVLSAHGKDRLRRVRQQMSDIADEVVKNIPLWADLPLLRALSKNAARGKKAFALAGQRMYVGGLSAREVAGAGMTMPHAVRAFGAAAARSAFVAEVCGSTDIPEGCDLLAGVCLMAGPVNQNDVGKQFFGVPGLLAEAHPNRQPSSLLLWTLKAKTVADPIGNEEQLLNAAKKGALVDLRPAPHDIIVVKHGATRVPMRHRHGRTNQERAFAAAGNFVTAPNGAEIPGNRGASWPWSHDDAFGASS